MRFYSAEVNFSQISLAKSYCTRSENFEFGVNYWLQSALTQNLLHKPCNLAENFESGKWRCCTQISPYYFFQSNVLKRDTLLPYLFCFYHYFVSRDLEVGLKKGEGFLYHCLLQMCFFRVWLPFWRLLDTLFHSWMQSMPTTIPEKWCWSWFVSFRALTKKWKRLCWR